jgi:hypothetical protein
LNEHVQRKGSVGVRGCCRGLAGVSGVHHVLGLHKGNVGISVRGSCQGFVVPSLCLHGAFNCQLCLYSRISSTLCILYYCQVLIVGVFKRNCL